jgi:acyl carrier protein
MQPAPIGVPGELYIGGVGVARGYWGKTDLTTERFLLNPNNNQNRVYKTGDRVRYLNDGKLEYLGRLDNQVKIRGFRIELGEIETVLTQHPHILQAVVTVIEDKPGEQRLVAYIVPNTTLNILNTSNISEDGEFTIKIRQYLGEKLPGYMIPAVFVVLEQLPLTPNGKVDRKALPSPNILRLTEKNSLVLPQTQIEREIAEIWCLLLGVETVSIHDNFFDLGGHSLLIVRMQGKLNERLNQDISLMTLFRYPTISSLAKFLAQTNTPTQLEQEVESRINQLEAGKQRLLQQRQQRQ